MARVKDYPGERFLGMLSGSKVRFMLKGMAQWLQYRADAISWCGGKLRGNAAVCLPATA